MSWLLGPTLTVVPGYEGHDLGGSFDPREREVAIGVRLATLRRRAHMTQMDVGKRLGYSQSRVAKVEIGERRLTLTDAVDLAALYGVSILDLLATAEWGPRPQRRRQSRSARGDLPSG